MPVSRKLWQLILVAMRRWRGAESSCVRSLLAAESYARELGVSNDMLRVAQRYAHGSLGLALIDFQRSGYMELWDPTQAEPLHTSRALNDAWEQCVFDAALAGQWQALRDLPHGTLFKSADRQPLCITCTLPHG